jgi:hypothetical protein
MAQETEYRIVTDRRPDIVVKEVNTALAEGWKLHGPLSVGPDFFAQAMVREKPGDSKYEEGDLLAFG